MSGRIGDTLREARQARGIELLEVERVTKIRVKYLHAIEDERWDVLPGRAYARGFLRTYAKLLDVDPEPLVAELDRDLEPIGPEEDGPAEPVVQPGTLRTGLGAGVWWKLAGALAGTAAVVVVLALALTGGGNGDEAPSPSPPPVEEEVEEPEEPETPPAEPSLVSLRLTALGAVWACVVDGRGEALVEGETLAEGDERGPFEARRMLMTFGNAQIEISADGDPIEVVDAGEPIGFEITSEGVEELPAEDRPTCA